MIKKLLALVILVLTAYAGFRWGPMVFPSVERALGLGEPLWVAASEGSGPGQPSAEIADATLDRFERFRRGDGDPRLVLGGNELSSIVRYALPGLIPPGVSDPTVVLDQGRVHISARVAVEAFPRMPQMEQVLGMLPDTVSIEVSGVLTPLDQRFMALMVDRVEASKIPVPRRLVGEILAGLGRGGPASLPEDALAVPIPDGIESLSVQMDSLVLIARR
jgi:hypothetical protein